MKKIYLVLILCTYLKVEAQTSTFSYIDNLLEKGRYQLALENLEKIDTLKEICNYKITSSFQHIL